MEYLLVSCNLAIAKLEMIVAEFWFKLVDAKLFTSEDTLFCIAMAFIISDDFFINQIYCFNCGVEILPIVTPAVVEAYVSGSLYLVLVSGPLQDLLGSACSGYPA